MNAEFERNKYLIVRDVIPRYLCDIVINYAKFQSWHSYTPEEGVAQVPNTHSRYADFLMESLLLHLQPILEKHVQRDVFPTYSYYRAYKQGDDLKPHTDRNACEVSMSLAFGWPNTPPWPFKLANDKDYPSLPDESSILTGNEKVVKVLLNPGDALIYAGPLVKHWRDPLPGAGYVQGFFHYVYADGPNASLKYDNRGDIGQPLEMKITRHL